MSKRVTFHVGLHKTGSSTIQQYLRSQDEKLRSFGVLYPGPREHEAMNERESHPLMFIAMTGLMTAPSEGLDLGGCREVVARVFEEFHHSDLENLIWSYEGMALTARTWDADYLERIFARRRCAHRLLRQIHRRLDRVALQGTHSVPGAAGSPEVFYGKPMPPIAPSPDAADGAAQTGRKPAGAGRQDDRSLADHAQETALGRNRRSLVRCGS